MVYCNECAKKEGWPVETFLNYDAPCEICHIRTTCNDVPSKHLPKKKELKL